MMSVFLLFRALQAKKLLIFRPTLQFPFDFLSISNPKNPLQISKPKFFPLQLKKILSRFPNQKKV